MIAPGVARRQDALPKDFFVWLHNIGKPVETLSVELTGQRKTFEQARYVLWPFKKSNHIWRSIIVAG